MEAEAVKRFTQAVKVFDTIGWCVKVSFLVMSRLLLWHCRCFTLFIESESVFDFGA